MIPAAWLLVRIRRFSRASLFNKSQRACAWSLIFAMGVLRTSRLVLRPFRADDIDRLAKLMANRDFMRFSLGPTPVSKRWHFWINFWRGKMQTNHRSSR